MGTNTDWGEHSWCAVQNKVSGSVPASTCRSPVLMVRTPGQQGFGKPRGLSPAGPFRHARQREGSLPDILSGDHAPGPAVVWRRDKGTDGLCGGVPSRGP